MGRLNEGVRKRTENIIREGFSIFIGDANGVDKAMQKYLAQQGYRNVIVFCTGSECRNNVGGWETRQIKSDREKRDFLYYTAKDVVMSEEADYGFMLWDGKSVGTFNNILNLLDKGKHVLVYFSPEKDFITLRMPSDVEVLLKKCTPQAVQGFQRRLGLKDVMTPSQTELNLTK